MQISFEEACKLKYKQGMIYSVTFNDGIVEGSKYSSESMNTSYMSYVPVYGGKYFTTFTEAENLAR